MESGRRPDECREVINEDAINRRAAGATGHGEGAHPGGRGRGSVFLVEVLSGNAVRVALQRYGVDLSDAAEGTGRRECSDR